jgi:hypothetical protein
VRSRSAPSGPASFRRRRFEICFNRPPEVKTVEVVVVEPHLNVGGSDGGGSESDRRGGVELDGGLPLWASGPRGGFVDFPRRWPAAKIPAATSATPIPIKTHAHQGSPPSSLLDFPVAVWLAFTLSDFELWTFTVPGLVAETVFVRVFVVVRGVSVFDWMIVFVSGSDFEGAVTVFVRVAAFEIFWLGFCGVVEVAAFVVPTPAVSNRLATPIARIARRSRILPFGPIAVNPCCVICPPRV